MYGDQRLITVALAYAEPALKSAGTGTLANGPSFIKPSSYLLSCFRDAFDAR